MGKLKNLAGQKFGRLVVTNYYQRIKRRRGTEIRWLCECECGEKTYVSSTKLKNGHTKSCGCYRKDVNKLAPGKAAFNVVYDSYKRSAEKRNLDFRLTEDEFKELTKMCCHYCGKKPSRTRFSKNRQDSYTYNGIDRVNSKAGYYLDNCVTCCGMCNRMKWAFKEDKFLKRIKMIYEYRRLDKWQLEQ